MSMIGGWYILLLQLVVYIPAVVLVILSIYALVLAIKALKIYISKNS